MRVLALGLALAPLDPLVSKYCQGAQTEVLSCPALEPCVEEPECYPVDMEMSEWGEWGVCSCEGLTFRQRRVVTHASCGGKVYDPADPESDEVAEIVAKFCEPTCTELPEHPVDCEHNEWGDWSACTKECGSGEQTRTRMITQHAAHCGPTCGATDELPLQEIKSCNVHDCVADADCTYGAWADWDQCTTTCGGGVQKRERSIVEAYGNGQGCDASEMQMQACGFELEADGTPIKDTCEFCPHFNQEPCVWDDWLQWGACSKDTASGEGVRDRQRHLKQPKGDGADQNLNCSHAFMFDNGEYTGGLVPLMEWETCNHKEEPTPVDAVWADWSAWGACSATCSSAESHGVRSKHRQIMSHARFGGELLQGSADEYERCMEDVPCPIPGQENCELGPWSDWGACEEDCCSSTKARSRTIMKYAKNGGLPCGSSEDEDDACLREIEQCCIEPVKEAPDAVDCQLSEWSDWGVCSVTCDGGQQIRTKQVLIEAEHGGLGCTGTLEETRGCNEQICTDDKCKLDVDCAWNDWEEWGLCSATCDGGEQVRFRTIAHPAQNNGKPCGFGGYVPPEPKVEDHCPVCLEKPKPEKGHKGPSKHEEEKLKEECAACKKKMPLSGRKMGIKSNMQVQPCAETHCGSEHFCVWGEWEQTTSCTKTCGFDNYERTRAMALTDVKPEGTPLASSVLYELEGLEAKFSSGSLFASAAAGFSVVVLGALALDRRPRYASVAVSQE